MVNFFLLLSLFAASDWTPRDRFTDERIYGATKEIRISGSAAPRYTFDAKGKLVPVNTQTTGTEEVGSKSYSMKTGSPMISGVRCNAATETPMVDVARSDLDWKFPDRRMEWELIGADFGKSKPAVIDEKEKVAAGARKISDSYQVFNNRTSVRRAARIPVVDTPAGIAITYRLRLVDLQIANPVDKAGFFVPDPTSGYFIVTTPAGEGRFEIRRPKLFDVNWQLVSENTIHTLRHIKGEYYEYVKMPSPAMTLDEIRKAMWFDADTTLYGLSNDGYIERTGTNFAVMRIATDGSGANNSGGYTVRGPRSTKEDATNYSLIRCFFEFDTTAITAYDLTIIQKAELYIYPYNSYTCEVGVYRGTQSDSLGTADFDGFTGGNIARQNWISSGANVFNLNVIPAQSSNAITAGGRTKFCLREFQCDGDGTITPTDNSTYCASVLFSETTGSGSDPMLILTLNAQKNSADKYYYVNQ